MFLKFPPGWRKTKAFKVSSSSANFAALKKKRRWASRVKCHMVCDGNHEIDGAPRKRRDVFVVSRNCSLSRCCRGVGLWECGWKNQNEARKCSEIDYRCGKFDLHPLLVLYLSFFYNFWLNDEACWEITKVSVCEPYFDFCDSSLNLNRISSKSDTSETKRSSSLRCI